MVEFSLFYFNRLFINTKYISFKVAFNLRSLQSHSIAIVNFDLQRLYKREDICSSKTIIPCPNSHIPPYTLYSTQKEREERYSMPNIGPKRRIYDFRYPASDISTEEPSDIFTDEESLPSNTSLEDNMSIEDEAINENVFSPTNTI